MDRSPALHQPIVESAAPPTADASAPRLGTTGVVVLIAVSHGTIDAYSAFLPPLLPRIMDKLGLSIALAATLATVLSLSTSLMQPAFGYLADRFGRRLFLSTGPLVTGVFLSLIGVAPTFTILLACLILGGIGSAAFHPPGAALIARASDGGGAGMRLSVFSFGGTAGFAIGPVAAVAIVAAVGLERLWIAMIPGVVLSVALWVALGRRRGQVRAPHPPPPREVLRLLAGPLGILFGVSAVGAFVQRTFLTFMPIIADRAGVSEAAGAAILSAYLGAQAFGTLAGGFLTDRVNRQRMMMAVSLAAVPVHLAAVVLPPASTNGIAAAIAAGFLNMALLPPVVVMAQEMVPRGAAASSGIVMGLAWAAGALLIPATGALGDVFGPVAAAAWSMPLLFVIAVLAAHPSLRPYGHAPLARDATGP
ncbi:MAG: MFS transporter [Gemmatimonadota bacterium]|nr:MFS transporter [Gemmatimonadota bacterium]